MVIAESHNLDINDPILVPDDGLLIGNGDLSVSIYQKSDALIFHFGKGDVWDRRLDLSDYPLPPHVDEIRRGLVEEGWQIDPKSKTVTATKGPLRDEKRMREICLGKIDGSNANARRPFPCPKPVGELALHLPIDLTGLKIRQRLTIETGVIDIAITSDAGVTIDLECFIPPSPNVLIVKWRHAGWDHARTVSPGRPVVWWSLYRWNDPSVEDYAATFMAVTGDTGYLGSAGPKATPLAPPTCGVEDGQHFVEQAFAPDPTFPGASATASFRYAITTSLRR